MDLRLGILLQKIHHLIVNQNITVLLLLRTDGCKHCQIRGFTVKQNQPTNLLLMLNYIKL